MGWTVHDVKKASVWEFWQAFQGYVEANTPKQGNKLTESERAELAEDILAYGQSITSDLSTQTYKLNGLRLVPAGIVTFEV